MLKPEIKFKIAIVGGARPNFMKMMPLVRVLKELKADFFVVNTGQHYSPDMADDFFKEFHFISNINLQPPRANPEERNSYIFEHLKEVFNQMKPGVVVVVGDVDSTLMAARAAHNLGIKVAHVESGLRSWNPRMKEEYNRIETDKISSFLLAPSKDAEENLKKECVRGKIAVVGNIMIDVLKIYEKNVPVLKEKFYFFTMHRAENVDDKKVFSEIIQAVREIKKEAGKIGIKLYLTLHPRTKKMAAAHGLHKSLEECFDIIMPPLSYADSIKYQKNALVVFTDSGGVQEESSILGTPCVTIRTETERPVTIDTGRPDSGTNIVVGKLAKENILNAYRTVYDKWSKTDFAKRPAQIPLWDGHTAERIVKTLCAE